MAEGARRIWVTRASPGAEATAARLRTLGFEAVVDPLLTVRDLSPALDLTDIAALAFTSVNGVAAFARRTADRTRPVFTVGDRTAQAARDAGFAEVASADGDVEALAALLVGQAARMDGAVLHPSALEPAGDLVSLLVAAGLPARRIAVYETIDQQPAPATLAGLDGLDAVLLHSPRAARKLADILGAQPAPNLRALCLSAAVAEPLQARVQAGDLASVAFAPHPSETALLDLLTA